MNERPIGIDPGSTEDALFRKLGDANLVGVGFGDLTGGIGYVNDEMLRMMGRTREELNAGRLNWQDCIAPECRDAARVAGERLASDGVARNYELAFVHRNGKRVNYLGAAALVRADGFHVSVAVDITREREVEAALRDADRLKNDAFAIVTHEIRQPLNVLETSLALLESTTAKGQLPAPHVLAAMRRQIEQLTRVSSDLLDATRVDRATLSVRLTTTDLRQVAQRALEEARDGFLRADINLVGAFDAHPIMVLGDSGRLIQAIANLLQNALKYSSAGSEVLLRIAGGNEATIVVRDRGKGIAPEHLQRVIEPFNRGGEHDARGLGLGLAIVRAIVELHGGSLVIESPGLGRGTSVKIVLPVV